MDQVCAVSFYGGEPLLEFELLKACVLYTEQEAKKRDKKTVFTITTNGTLLNDEVIRFLVEHEFLIMVSLDGPKEAHDRYRVFGGCDGHKGSFEQVMKNLNRFVELYPDYRRRGLSMTLAPPILWHETEELVQEMFPLFPMTRVTMVNTDGKKENRSCSEQCDCQKAPLDLNLSNKDELILQREFVRFEQALRASCLEEVLHAMPLHTMLFSPTLRMIHERLVTSRPLPNTFVVPCLPGYSRRFCDIYGNYHICERVDSSSRYCLGNVETGYDVAKAIRLMQWYNEITDCANCVSMKTCNLCYAALTIPEDASPLTGTRLGTLCRGQCEILPVLLQNYVEIMEQNPAAFRFQEGSHETTPITFLPKIKTNQGEIK